MYGSEKVKRNPCELVLFAYLCALMTADEPAIIA